MKNQHDKNNRQGQRLFVRISTKVCQPLTLLLLAICCVSLVAAFIIEDENNLLCIVMCYAAAVSGVLAFSHQWRRPKYFLILSGAAIVGFALGVVLHNVFYALNQITSGIIVLSHLLGFFHIVFFLVAIFVCPAAFVMGVFGSVVRVVTYRKSREG